MVLGPAFALSHVYLLLHLAPTSFLCGLPCVPTVMKRWWRQSKWSGLAVTVRVHVSETFFLKPAGDGIQHSIQTYWIWSI